MAVYGFLNESRNPLGYRGTKKIEKKYNIPSKYCVKLGQFWNLLLDNKNSDKIVDAVKGAIKYIKDEDDLNNYFSAILRDTFMHVDATGNDALVRYPVLKKLYTLYDQSYKGDNKITLQDLFYYVHQNKVIYV